MDIVVGNLITYKPLKEGIPKNDRHMVKVIETYLSEMLCEDIFGNQFRLGYGRVETVIEETATFNAIQEACK